MPPRKSQRTVSSSAASSSRSARGRRRQPSSSDAGASISRSEVQALAVKGDPEEEFSEEEYKELLWRFWESPVAQHKECSRELRALQRQRRQADLLRDTYPRLFRALQESLRKEDHSRALALLRRYKAWLVHCGSGTYRVSRAFAALIGGGGLAEAAQSDDDEVVEVVDLAASSDDEDTIDIESYVLDDVIVMGVVKAEPGSDVHHTVKEEAASNETLALQPDPPVPGPDELPAAGQTGPTCQSGSPGCELLTCHQEGCNKQVCTKHHGEDGKADNLKSFLQCCYPDDEQRDPSGGAVRCKTLFCRDHKDKMWWCLKCCNCDFGGQGKDLSPWWTGDGYDESYLTCPKHTRECNKVLDEDDRLPFPPYTDRCVMVHCPTCHEGHECYPLCYGE